MHLISVPVIVFLSNRYGVIQGHHIPKNFLMLFTLLIIGFIQLTAVFNHDNVFLKLNVSPEGTAKDISRAI
jgi:hypothetical protein